MIYQHLQLFPDGVVRLQLTVVVPEERSSKGQHQDSVYCERDGCQVPIAAEVGERVHAHAVGDCACALDYVLLPGYTFSLAKELCAEAVCGPPAPHLHTSLTGLNGMSCHLPVNK